MNDAQHRNDVVWKILREATRPLTSLDICRQINEPWAMYAPNYPNTAAVSAVLKRIGAEKVKRGLWIAPIKD